MRRREFAVGLAAAGLASGQAPVKRKGRIKQSAMVMNFPPGMALEDMCRIAAQAGCVGMDFFASKDWPTIKRFGLIPTTAPRTIMTIEDGVIHRDQHPALEKALHESIDECASFGCPNIIAVGGQRRGLSYEEGADILVSFFNRIKARAEDKGINIVMEVMNSKYTNPDIGRVDQICDHLPFAVDVCKRVNSPRIKVLFDIYHVQIMDGNIGANIRDNLQWIGHFHTGGVPGRHEIDDSQELNYRFIAQTIASLPYSGYVAHEYRLTPGRDPLRSLSQAVEIMDV